jgi:hypothetical protein
VAAARRAAATSSFSQAVAALAAGGWTGRYLDVDAFVIGK